MLLWIWRSKLAKVLPVCEVVFPPPRERVAILTHIRNPTPGCLHDLQSVCVQLSSHCQSKKCLHFLNFAIYETPVLALNKMTPFYFKRVELVEICLPKKTKNKTTEHIYLEHMQNILQVDNILSQKTSLRKFKRTEIIPSGIPPLCAGR